MVNKMKYAGVTIDELIVKPMMPTIKVKKLGEDVILPTRGSEFAAGYDLYAYAYDASNANQDWSVMINPGGTLKISTGIIVELPECYFGGIYPRSGLATKQGLAPANKVGVIDSDYRGPIIVALHNHSEIPQIIHKGDRIAQLIVQPYFNYVWEEVEEIDETKRGNGGFGSTGTN